VKDYDLDMSWSALCDYQKGYTDFWPKRCRCWGCLKMTSVNT
jgi:hypothetical protein